MCREGSLYRVEKKLVLVHAIQERYGKLTEMLCTNCEPCTCINYQITFNLSHSAQRTAALIVVTPVPEIQPLG